ncbi:2-amino-4-hydroxy-6-hydroxymethyldihydropteridinediphosphokinase [Roseivivax lentus]|uniref:2-amino-4-hydroxy-6-hydroxymethyldihydropteridine pyrophosphokinase n=2 Tax=Roseivivax lentus TaxID=633194 RepID=A0A1N7K482_9RHOB|nr:2-amino-4-hydroxy-6-hydroxymethyldihydropteridinediphosphokinase [Roseivivax lentus]
MQVRQDAVIALGGNLPLGDHPPAETLLSALKKIGQTALQIRAISRFYATPCFPANAGPDYVNAAALLSLPAGMTPEAALAELHAVEAVFGRARAQRWGMRTLDLDLIALGDLVRPDAETQTRWRKLAPDAQRQEAPETLILPHPRLQDRGFVLVPMADIAPHWTHPLTGQSVREMRDALPPGARAEITPL